MKPFHRASFSEQQMKSTMDEYRRHYEVDPMYFAQFGITDVSQIESVLSKSYNCEVYKNDQYQVAVYRNDPPMDGWPRMIHLSIKRLDRQPIRDWRDLQEIKNLIVGHEHEAVELYPAESRLVDLANQYHLWVIAETGVKFPFGFQSRHVDDVEIAGSKQRKRTSTTKPKRMFKRS